MRRRPARRPDRIRRPHLPVGPPAPLADRRARSSRWRGGDDRRAHPLTAACGAFDVLLMALRLKVLAAGLTAPNLARFALAAHHAGQGERLAAAHQALRGVSAGATMDPHGVLARRGVLVQGPKGDEQPDRRGQQQQTSGCDDQAPSSRPPDRRADLQVAGGRENGAIVDPGLASSAGPGFFQVEDHLKQAAPSQHRPVPTRTAG